MSETPADPAASHDPRGLIRESFRMPGIGVEDCRSIFLDWALGLGAEQDMAGAATALLAHYRPDPAHPMSVLLAEAGTAAPKPARSGGARARRQPR